MSGMVRLCRTTGWRGVRAAPLIGLSVLTTRYALADENVALGVKAFRVGSACHSLRPGLNMTGPSLADVWERKAGSLGSFDRYSDALKKSGVTWNARTLGGWLANPAQFIPRNSMTYSGVSDPQIRGALIQFLRDVNKPGTHGPTVDVPSAYTATPKDLKYLAIEEQVNAIRSCRDSYFVTTADGRTRPFSDQNLRFETDASRFGPEHGKPAFLDWDVWRSRRGDFLSTGGDQRLYQTGMLMRAVGNSHVAPCDAESSAR